MRFLFIYVICFISFFSGSGMASTQRWSFDEDAIGNEFLLTFPRSGTNLISCYLQALTGKPIHWIKQNDRRTSDNRIHVPINYSKLVLWRDHGKHDLLIFNKNQNKLLFVLRNYKECISRHMASKEAITPEQLELAFLMKSDLVLQYINNIKMYDNWDPENRLLINYEDLISNPVSEMRKVLEFFDEPVRSHRLNSEFLAAASKRALRSYQAQHGSHSKGKDTLYHSKKLPNEVLLSVDSEIEASWPDLWEKYLMRYQTIFKDKTLF